MTPEDFQRDFHTRTLAYTPAFALDPRPVVVLIGDTAQSAPGHALAASLVNLLARAHKRLVIVGDLDRPLLIRDPLGATTLHQAAIEQTTAINPFIEIHPAGDIPNEPALITIGLGTNAELTIGADRWCAHFGPGARIDPAATTMLGAALAAPIAAAAAFHRQLGSPGLPSGSFSLWDGVAPSRAQGPDFEGPIDVGHVLQAGAGAVACALDYWLAILGIRGAWTIADGDTVDATNLNRQKLFTARHAGYPQGNPAFKATIAAGALGPNAQAHTDWIDQISEIDKTIYDIILPLANERGARRRLQSRAEPLLLHATTTPSWGASSHRHISGHDDCIVCRLPDADEPTFACSTATIHTERRIDAALPFLSDAAGVLLLGELIRLQLGQLADRTSNNTLLDFRTSQPISSSYRWPGCNPECRTVLPSDTRVRLNHHTRWAALDRQALSATRHPGGGSFRFER